MEKISGLVLDASDDINGEVMHGMYPTLDEVPHLLKTASLVSPEQRESLPDEVFALVLVQDGSSLRKYACVDGGNTALNVAYFLNTYEKLPMEAVKVAASNLEIACGWYDLEPPDELKKLSTGSIPVIGKQQFWRDQDGQSFTNDNQSWGLNKTAEVSGTIDMDGGVGARKESVSPSRSKLSVTKTAEERFAESLEVGEGMPTADNPPAAPQAGKVLTPHVDVTSKEPPKLVEKKAAAYYAMPTLSRYPIDGIDQIKTASAYFTEYYKQMEPQDRREFGYNLVKRASAVGVPVEKVAYAYAGEGYAEEHLLHAAVETRINLLDQSSGFEEDTKTASLHVAGLYHDLLDKRHGLTPDVYAATLSEIDKLAGFDELYDKDLDDPYASTFYKAAEDANPKDAVVLGNEYMNVTDLELFGQRGGKDLEMRFGADFVSEFQKDPKGIFDSLPVDQKKVIMRLVNNSHSQIQGASAS